MLILNQEEKLPGSLDLDLDNIIIHTIMRIRQQDRHILEIKRKHSRIAEFMD